MNITQDSVQNFFQFQAPLLRKELFVCTLLYPGTADQSNDARGNYREEWAI